MTSTLQPHELFGILSSTEKVHRIVDFPRKDASGKPLFELALVLLTQQEVMSATANAEKTLKKLTGTSTPAVSQTQAEYDLYNNCLAVELLFRACKHPNDLSKNIFPTPLAISDALSTDEIAILANNYQRMKTELGPIVGAMSEDEIEIYINNLIEGGKSTTYFLDLLSSGMQSQLIVAMASRLQSYRMDKSSVSLPQSDTTTTE